MNSKIYKFAAILLVIFAVMAVVLSLLFGKSQPRAQPENPSANNQAEILLVSPAEQESITKFVKNFLTLYNNYGYEDYSNLEALGDYQTENAQKQTIKRMEQLKAETPVGFRRTVQLDKASIKIEKLGILKTSFKVSAKLPAIDSVENQAPVSSRSADTQGSKAINLEVELRLVPYNQGWLVDDILIVDQ